ncbi:MAG TPA: hypothetical protein VD886_21920 [Herpetosiphonaceae bacterium]|nr:hypothetical protein [Herpetosiphonaceae bacterium]
MKIYWGANSIPELKGLPKAEQRRLWFIGLRAGLRKPRVWAAYALMITAIMVGVALPSILELFPGNLALAALWGGLWGGLGSFIANQIIIAAIRPVLALHRAALEARSRADDGSYYVPPAI